MLKLIARQILSQEIVSSKILQKNRLVAAWLPGTEAGDGLACALFAIPGVTNVLVHTAFVTVGKAPDAKWAPIRRSVRAVLQRHGDHADE